MIKIIDDFLNGITQYRLILYFLIVLLALAVSLSFFQLLPFSAFNLLLSAAFLTGICWVTNKIFAKIFKVPTNLESVYITAFILTLIITPPNTLQDLMFLSTAAVVSQVGKYFLAINKKHIFNPAALGVVSLLLIKSGASWWVGNLWMMPVVFLGGLLVARKLRKFQMALSFLVIFIVTNFGTNLQTTVFESPVLFFAFVMLTEPQTTPPKRIWQIVYGSLVGLLLAPFVHFGSFYLTPEIVLLSGNIFSFIVSPKEKLLVKLVKKIQIASDIYDFIFDPVKKLNFLPGQYLEWTLGHKNPDSRGNRRYFTIASSPAEGNLRIGVKFYPNGSSFKKSLNALKPGSQILAGQLSGEFNLPKDPDKKLCFIAGGIGITPYRSITKYLLDKGETRNIILLYSNKLAQDIVYKDIFDAAFKRLNMKTVYILSDTANIPVGWTGRVGFIDAKVITAEIPDFKDRVFFISGSHSMVDTFERTLKGMGVNGQQIKVDFFPGYA